MWPYDNLSLFTWKDSSAFNMDLISKFIMKKFRIFINFNNPYQRWEKRKELLDVESTQG